MACLIHTFRLSRWREEIQQTKSVEAALVQVLLHAGHTIFISGMTLLLYAVAASFPPSFLCLVSSFAGFHIIIVSGMTLLLCGSFFCPLFFNWFDPSLIQVSPVSTAFFPRGRWPAFLGPVCAELLPPHADFLCRWLG